MPQLLFIASDCNTLITSFWNYFVIYQKYEQESLSFSLQIAEEICLCYYQLHLTSIYVYYKAIFVLCIGSLTVNEPL